jgi:hypothetical protein
MVILGTIIEQEHTFALKKNRRDYLPIGFSVQHSAAT